MAKIIYVLHEYGAPTHSAGLSYYCSEKGIELRFFEFSWLRQIILGFLKADFKKIKKGIINLFFLVGLLIKKNKVIVLGMAPFDYRMIFFNSLSSRHHFLYHTSWPYWDGDRFPMKGFFYFFGGAIRKNWTMFFEERCNGIFCVSNAAQNSICKNYNISCPINTVYHSVDKSLFYPSIRQLEGQSLKFLFVGQLEGIKGVNELLELSKNLMGKGFYLGITGGGTLSGKVLESAKSLDNMTYHGYINRNELGSIYREYDFLLCPSKKYDGGVWEELFGMVIVEAMACGLVPIATNHTGPNEIIENSVNGFLLRDENLYEDLLGNVGNLISLEKTKVLAMKNLAFETARKYYISEISKRWEVVLNDFYNKARLI